MKCPIDGADLVMAERQGVEIDYCPSCRGVWLDRGELDKILDRAAEQARPAGAAAAPPAPAAVPVPPAPVGGVPRYDDAPYDERRSGGPRYDERRYDERSYDQRRYDPRYRGQYRKKKESWLSDLLDFD